MFYEVLKVATESTNFEELKMKLKRFYIDASIRINGFIATTGSLLAKEGKHNAVEWMRHLGANVSSIAQGYALAGNHEKVEVYRLEHGANVSSIALSYALANNHEKVEIFRTEHGANVNAVAKGYALADNHEKVEVYRIQHRACVSSIVLGFALANNLKKLKKYDVNYILDSYLEERTAVKNSFETTKEYFYGNFFSAFQKSFTQKKDAVNALKSALQGNNVDLIEHLSTLRNGHLGNELRAFVKSGMGNTLVGNEVTTVSDFIQALQDKISQQVKP